MKRIVPLLLILTFLFHGCELTTPPLAESRQTEPVLPALSEVPGFSMETDPDYVPPEDSGGTSYHTTTPIGIETDPDSPPAGGRADASGGAVSPLGICSAIETLDPDDPDAQSRILFQASADLDADGAEEFVCLTESTGTDVLYSLSRYPQKTYTLHVFRQQGGVKLLAAQRSITAPVWVPLSLKSDGRLMTLTVRCDTDSYELGVFLKGGSIVLLNTGLTEQTIYGSGSRLCPPAGHPETALFALGASWEALCARFDEALYVDDANRVCYRADTFAAFLWNGMLCAAVSSDGLRITGLVSFVDTLASYNAACRGNGVLPPGRLLPLLPIDEARLQELAGMTEAARLAALGEPHAVWDGGGSLAWLTEDGKLLVQCPLDEPRNVSWYVQSGGETLRVQSSAGTSPSFSSGELEIAAAQASAPSRSLLILTDLYLEQEPICRVVEGAKGLSDPTSSLFLEPVGQAPLLILQDGVLVDGAADWERFRALCENPLREKDEAAELLLVSLLPNAPSQIRLLRYDGAAYTLRDGSGARSYAHLIEDRSDVLASSSVTQRRTWFLLSDDPDMTHADLVGRMLSSASPDPNAPAAESLFAIQEPAIRIR